MAALNLESENPQFEARKDDYILTADAFHGERVVKAKGGDYLPLSSGQRALGAGKTNINNNVGQALYEAYKARAVFPDILRHTKDALLGVMLREPWVIEVPPTLEPILKSATTRGEDIIELVDRMLARILLFGRSGLLVEINEDTNIPYIADYNAIQIINWDDNPKDTSTQRKLKLVVLDESRSELDDASLQWSDKKRFRKLSIEGNVYTAQVEQEKALQTAVTPGIQGRTFERIPFIFVNATDMSPSPGEVPLLGLARLAMTIYRSEADYRQSLFMQGQDTLVLRGVANPGNTAITTVDDNNRASYNEATQSEVIIGAGSILYLPDPEADAKFIGVESQGLKEQREALENDYQRAEQFGISLLTSGDMAESEGTVGKRAAARTASLQSIAKTAAQGLEAALKIAAEWMGADVDKVKVTPSLDFIDNPAIPAEILSLVNSKLRGMPFSWKTIHAYAQKGGLTDLDFDAELEAITEEPNLGLDVDAGEDDDDSGGGGGGGGGGGD